MKQGDLITVQAEAVSTSYEQHHDFNAVKIEVTGNISGFEDIEALSEKDIYKIVRNDAHEDIVKAGGNSCYYSVEGEPIESLVFPKKTNNVPKGHVRINGSHDIPFKTATMTSLSEAHFFDEKAAQVIATEMNKIELKRAKALQAAMDKVVVMLGQIVDKALV